MTIKHANIIAIKHIHIDLWKKYTIQKKMNIPSFISLLVDNVTGWKGYKVHTWHQTYIRYLQELTFTVDCELLVMNMCNTKRYWDICNTLVLQPVKETQVKQTLISGFSKKQFHNVYYTYANSTNTNIVELDTHLDCPAAPLLVENSCTEHD